MHGWATALTTTLKLKLFLCGLNEYDDNFSNKTEFVEQVVGATGSMDIVENWRSTLRLGQSLGAIFFTNSAILPILCWLCLDLYRCRRSRGLRLWNGFGDQLTTVFLPSPFLSDAQQVLPEPQWERLDLYYSLREKYLGEPKPENFKPADALNVNPFLNGHG